MHKHRAPNPHQVLMHALQQIGYHGDDDELAEIADTFLYVNKVRQSLLTLGWNPMYGAKFLLMIEGHGTAPHGI